LIAVTRQRLTRGDFEDADRIAVSVEGQRTLTDTFVVRSGRRLVLPNLPELQLTGILRTELQPYLENHVAKYIRNPIVRATPLVRLLVSGSVARPGGVSVPPDTPIIDIIMRAGGPTPAALIDKATVRRDDKEFLSAKVLHSHLTGTTLEDLGLRSGDQIDVPAQVPSSFNVTTVVQLAATISGALLAWMALSRSRQP
jgi:polysaccharide export outer membrane protein